MKKKVVSALLLLVSLVFIACGENNKNKEVNTDNNVIEAITETDSSVTETNNLEPEESVNVIESTSPSEVSNEYAFVDESSLEFHFNNDYSKVILVDGDKEIPFSLNGYAPEAISAYKMDINQDSKDEYVVTICEGRGTGFYQTGLVIVEEGKDEPVFYLSASDIIDEINSRIKYDFIDDYKILFVSTDENEPAEVYLKKSEERYESTYENAFWGDVEYIENKNGEFWIYGPIGLQFKSMVTPQYDESIFISAPILLDEDNNYTIGKLSLKVLDDYLSSNQFVSYGEIISSFEADITHNGLKDKLLLVTPKGATIDDVKRGVEPGLFYLLEGNGDNSFSNNSSLYREFSGAHVGNGQMFVTTMDGRDYLIETNFWCGQGTFTYNYEVFFEDYRSKYSIDSKSLIFEQCDQPGDTGEFFEGLNKWINDSTYILYAADIDYDPELQYSTKDNIISAKEYLSYKANFLWD